MQQRNGSSAALLNTLHSLGLTLEAQGKLPDAEAVLRRRLELWQKASEDETPRASSEAEDLSRILRNEGKEAEAEKVQIETLAIRRRLFGDDSTEVATSLNDLADVYTDERKYTEAESVSRQSLDLRQKLLNPESLEVADSLRTLAMILGNEGKWTDAEATAEKVLAMRRKCLGPENPSVASALQDLAWVKVARGELAEAQALEREALEMRGKVLSEEHPDIAQSIYLLGNGLRQRGDLEDAYAVLSTALSMQKTEVGEAAPSALYTLRSLGWTLEGEGKLSDAEETFRHGLDLWQRIKSRGLPEQEGLARVLIAEHKFHDAEVFLDQMLTSEVVKESSSVDLLNLRANLLARQGRFREAVEDATLVAKYKPSSLDFYHPLAGLLAITDDPHAYSNLCQKILITFTNVTSYQAMCMALDCLVLPNCGVDPTVGDKLADKALALGKNDGSMPDFQACKALSQYRLGDFPGAIEWAQKPLNSYSDYARAKAYSVLAMAEWRLGSNDVARAMLTAAETNAPDMLKASAPDLGPEWNTWLLARIQVNEAAKLIKSDLKADNN
jgi:tetratricopeptide (TPR) repeat protein